MVQHLHIRKNKIVTVLVTFLLFCGSCQIQESNIPIAEKEKYIVDMLYSTSCFKEKIIFKDSIKSVNSFLESYFSGKDSVNSITIQLFKQGVGSCDITRILYFEKGGIYYGVPYCLVDTKGRGSYPTVDSITAFSIELKKVIDRFHIKDKKYFLDYLFKQVLISEPCKIEETKILSIKDSIEISKHLSTVNVGSYQIRSENNSFWTVSIINDTVKINLVNANMYMCFDI